MTNEQIAKVCHEANRAYCETIGDTTQLPWEQAAEWQRQSAVKGVEYKLANRSATPADQHEAWCRDKYRDGWKVGPVKDAEKKEHPCLAPYAELPAEQRAKDAIFVAIVSALSPSNA